VTECQLNFNFQPPSVLLQQRRETFVNASWIDAMVA